MQLEKTIFYSFVDYVGISDFDSWIARTECAQT